MEIKMKKIILFLIIFCFCLPVFAEVFFEPEWSEFCPSRYANIDSSRWHYTSSGRYWAKRKQQFENRLEKCNSLRESSREACYKTLREIENNETANYNNGKTSRTLRYMMINSMF
jgi:hypothetical protein